MATQNIRGASAVIIWNPERASRIQKAKVNSEIDKAHAKATQSLQTSTNNSVESLRPALVDYMKGQIQDIDPTMPDVLAEFFGEMGADLAVEQIKDEMGESINESVGAVTKKVKKVANASIDGSVRVADGSISSISGLFV